MFARDFFFRGHAVTYRDIPEGDSTVRPHVDFFLTRTDCLFAGKTGDIPPNEGAMLSDLWHLADMTASSRASSIVVWSATAFVILSEFASPRPKQRVSNVYHTYWTLHCACTCVLYSTCACYCKHGME